MTRPHAQVEGAIDLAVFLVELVLLAKLALAAVASALLAISGEPVWALAFLMVAGALLTIGESREHRAGARA